MYDEHEILLDGRRFGTVEFAGIEPPLVALHGSFGRGLSFAPLAAALGRRVVALDQRCHGRSEHGGPVTPDAYVDDAAALLRALDLAPAVLLGHSMGGVVAYRLAARHPELVHALIVEDVGAVTGPPEIEHPVLDVRGWPRRAATREALAEELRARGILDPAYFLQSAEPDGDGWRYLFDWDEMLASQQAGVGDFWDDWLASTCPALLLHGHASIMLPTPLARTMAARRPNTVLREFPAAGHWLHDDDPEGMAAAIRELLDR